MSPTAESLVNVALAVIPSILALIRGSVSAGTPAPTDAEILAALAHAVTESLAQDDAWRAAHPPTP